MYSLHPVTIDLVEHFLGAIEGTSTDDQTIVQARDGLQRLIAGDSRGPDAVSSALALYLTAHNPVFVSAEISLSGWEASIERGIGMLMRPPSRLFVDAGMERSIAQRFPIRLDKSGGAMSGAYVPPTLIPQLHELLVSRLKRQLLRLVDAEMEPVLAMAGLLGAVSWAHSNGTGLLEAADVVYPGMPAREIVQLTNRKQVDPGLRAEFEELIKPQKKPGMVARLMGRSQPKAGTGQR